MHEQLPWDLVSGGEEQRGPEDAVEPEDVLRQQVADGRPERRHEVLAGAGVGERAQVVDERVRPDVDDLVGIPGDRDAPRLAGPADREVLEPSGDERPCLVRAEPGQDEVRALVVEREQLLLVRGEPEEPVRLLDPLGLDVVLRALPVDQLVLVLERLASDAVEARIDVLVDVLAAVVADPEQELLDEPLVLVVARPDEEVVGHVEAGGERPPRLHDLVRVLLRLEALLGRDAGHLRCMLVDPREQERLTTALPLVAGEDVRGHGRVRVPDVRGRVHVVDRRREVVRLHSRRFYGRLSGSRPLRGGIRGGTPPRAGRRARRRRGSRVSLRRSRSPPRGSDDARRRHPGRFARSGRANRGPRTPTDVRIPSVWESRSRRATPCRAPRRRPGRLPSLSPRRRGPTPLGRGRGGGIAGHGRTGFGDVGPAPARVDRRGRPSVGNVRRGDREPRLPSRGASTRPRRTRAGRGTSQASSRRSERWPERVSPSWPQVAPGRRARTSGEAPVLAPSTDRAHPVVGAATRLAARPGPARGPARRRSRRRHGSRPGWKEPERVDVRVGVARAPDAEVDARDGVLGRPAPPHRPDRRAFVDGRALLDGDRAEVDERDRKAVRRLDGHAAAIRRERPGERHGSRGGCADRGPFGPGDVDATVLTARVRVGAQGKRTEHCAVGGPCPGPCGRAECQRCERRHADNEESVHEAPPSFTARATRVVER